MIFSGPSTRSAFGQDVALAAFLKEALEELVYGEDDEHRAESQVVRGLFEAVRRSYFRLYFNFMYFDVAKPLDLILQSSTQKVTEYGH